MSYKIKCNPKELLFFPKIQSPTITFDLMSVLPPINYFLSRILLTRRIGIHKEVSHRRKYLTYSTKPNVNEGLT